MSAGPIALHPPMRNTPAMKPNWTSIIIGLLVLCLIVYVFVVLLGYVPLLLP